MNRRLRKLHRTLVRLGFARDGSETRAIRYTGALTVSGLTVHCAILFDDLEFARLPRLLLLAPDKDIPELVAHVQTDGDYCYAHRDGYVLDRFDVVGSTALSIQWMRESLEHSLTSHAIAEIAAEFPQHWFGCTTYIDVKDPGADRAKLFRVVRAAKPDVDVLADSSRVVRLMASGSKPAEVPVALIRTNSVLTFLKGHRRPETFAEFLEWLSAIDPTAGAQALKSAQTAYPNQPHVFVLAPNGTVGVRLEFVPAWWKSFKRPEALARYVDQHRHKVKVVRIIGEAIDPDFIYRRNMHTQPNLSGKRITLVGCGTIGSHLAKMLAQSGAGYGPHAHLRLVDQQTLTPGNVGRHLLGVPHIGMPKAIGVRDTLITLYPDLNTSAIFDDALKNLKALAADHLVIDATGDEGVANALNAHFVERRKCAHPAPATVFGWLFGNGAAAQALCVTSAADACYRCLRPDHGGPWRFSPLKPEYETREVAAQCGEGPFFPYGVAAPVTAAALALQLALDWAKGEPTPRLRTQRLVFRETRQVRDQDPSRSPHCPACGSE
jgi:molybdopterin/thiamine biosynthesis adenylyltransferase